MIVQTAFGAGSLVTIGLSLAAGATASAYVYARSASGMADVLRRSVLVRYSLGAARLVIFPLHTNRQPRSTLHSHLFQYRQIVLSTLLGFSEECIKLIWPF